MRKKQMPRFFTQLFLILLIVAQNACSNLEPELRKLSNNPSTIVVIKDVNGGYWALSASRIKQINKNKIIISEGTVVAKGSGTAPAKEIASALIELRSKSNPGGFGATETQTSSASGEVSGKIEVIEKDMELEVKEIVSKKSSS